MHANPPDPSGTAVTLRSRLARCWRTPVLLGLAVNAVLMSLASCGGKETPEQVPCNHPYRITNEGIDGQVGVAGSVLASPLSVDVVCANSSLNVGGSVNWTVLTGGGALDDMTTLTAASTHSIQWRLGSMLGEQTVRADYVDPVDGTQTSTVFHATAIAPTGCDPAQAGTQQAGFDQERIITANETWSAAGSPHRGGILRVRDGAVLTIEPGAKVCVQQLSMEAGGRLIALGGPGARIAFTLADPTQTWAGLFFSPPAFGTQLPAPSQVAFVDIENPLFLTMSGNHPVQIRDSRIARLAANTQAGYCPQWQLVMTVSGSGERTQVERVVVDRFGGPGCPAVNLDTDPFAPTGTAFAFSARVIGSGGDGVRANSMPRALALSQCEISGSAGDGLVVVQGPLPVSIGGCNLRDNGGVGIRNLTTGGFLQVAAQGNWWGDPAGPGGPTGDGVSGDVDAASPLAAPVTLGY